MESNTAAVASTYVQETTYVSMPTYVYGNFETASQVLEDLREHVEQAYALLDDDSI